MSPDHESSYYEIALTNRQVLTIFVVLLTCLVAAFLSGVWIGQREGSEGVLAAAAEASPGQEAKEQLTELNFFSEAPPLNGRKNREPAAEPRPAEAPPPEKEKPPPPAAVAEVPPPPVADPKPSPPPAPERVAAAETPPAPPAAVATGPVVQVFSTADAGQARRLVQRLGAGGYPVFLHRESLQGQMMYRVRVGPYREETEARKIADELRREYRLDTWITSQQPG